MKAGKLTLHNFMTYNRISVIKITVDKLAETILPMEQKIYKKHNNIKVGRFKRWRERLLDKKLLDISAEKISISILIIYHLQKIVFFFRYKAFRVKKKMFLLHWVGKLILADTHKTLKIEFKIYKLYSIKMKKSSKVAI